jgi:chaperonin GroES
MNKILLNLKEKNMALTPLHDRVLVRLLDAETKSPTGEVLATGNGRITTEGLVIPMTVKVGNRIMFGQYSGQKVKVDGEELTVLKEDDILAIVE